MPAGICYTCSIFLTNFLFSSYTFLKVDFLFKVCAVNGKWKTESGKESSLVTISTYFWNNSKTKYEQTWVKKKEGYFFYVHMFVCSYVHMFICSKFLCCCFLRHQEQQQLQQLQSLRIPLDIDESYPLLLVLQLLRRFLLFKENGPWTNVAALIVDSPLYKAN